MVARIISSKISRQRFAPDQCSPVAARTPSPALKSDMSASKAVCFAISGTIFRQYNIVIMLRTAE